MKANFSILLLGVVFLVCFLQQAAAQQSECPPGQEYTSCGSPCRERCGDTEPKICAAVCVPGCQCPRGLILNQRNECVPPNRC